MRTLEEQWIAAKKEGPVVVSLPGQELRGFVDQDAAMAYVEMWQIANDHEGEMILRVHTGDQEQGGSAMTK